MTGVEFLFVFLAGVVVGGVAVGVVHAERRDHWRQLARRDRRRIHNNIYNMQRRTLP